MHLPTLTILVANVKKSSDIHLLSPHLDLLAYFFELGLMS